MRSSPPTFTAPNAPPSSPARTTSARSTSTRTSVAAPDNIAWRAPKEPVTPWQAEWTDLLDAIRNDKPHNEAKRAAMSNLADLMGRAAVHTGQIVTWDQMMASNFQFCPNIDQLTADSPPPIQPDAQGRYPVPVPGQWTEV